MTAIPGSIRVTGFIAPSDSADTYAVTDDVYHRGGFRPVANVTARDAITEDRRKVGMLVYCVAEDTYYQCTVATTPPTWVEASMDGSSDWQLVPVLASPHTLVEADGYKIQAWSAADTGSLQLPLLSTLTDGWWVRVFNLGSGTPVVEVHVDPADTGLLWFISPGSDVLINTNYRGICDFVAHEVAPATFMWIAYPYSGVWSNLLNTRNYDGFITGGSVGRVVNLDIDGNIQDSGVDMESLLRYVRSNIASTPRVVIEDDANTILAWTGANVGVFTLPTSVAAGEGFRFRVRNEGTGTHGVTINTVSGNTISLGGNMDGGGAGTSLVTTDLNASVELVANGATSWYVTMANGTWTDGTITRHFDAHIPGGTLDNIVTIDAYGDLVDSGTAITSVGGINLTTFSASAIDLVDDTDFVALEITPYVTEATGYILEVVPTVGAGTLTVVLYQDAARLEAVYTMVVDLSDSTTFQSFEAFGMELETDGTIYGTAFVSGVALGETFDISIKAMGLEPSAAPAPLPSPYGQGIEDDGGGLPRIALASDSGLAFDMSDKLVIFPDVTAPATISLGIGGVAVTGAVTTTTDEDIAAKKRFTAVGVEPLADPGPPAAGDYLTGQEILDSNNVKWRCAFGGTPGDWILADCVADDQADYYTSVLGAGASEVIEIITTGDVGVLQVLQIWGVVVTTVAEYTSDFRARIYRTSDLFGREMVWQGVGIARQSYLTAILPDSSDEVPVNDIDMFDTDEACVIFEDFERYEMGRIYSRGTGILTLDEALVDPSSWAADTLVCSVTQFENVPFRNTDASVSNRGRAYLQIRNDHVTNDVQFFVRVLPLSIGIGQEILM